MHFKCCPCSFCRSFNFYFELWVVGWLACCRHEISSLCVCDNLICRQIVPRYICHWDIWAELACLYLPLRYMSRIGLSIYAVEIYEKNWPVDICRWDIWAELACLYMPLRYMSRIGLSIYAVEIYEKNWPAYLTWMSLPICGWDHLVPSSRCRPLATAQTIDLHPFRYFAASTIW